MRRIVWIGSFVGLAWIGFTAHSDAKTIHLRCEGMLDGDKRIQNIVADDVNKSVNVSLVLISKDSEIRQKFVFTNDVYAKIFTYGSIKSFDGTHQNEFDEYTKNDVKLRKPQHQHVSIHNNKIQFGTTVD